MVSSVKLHILKKGEYILWTMKMKQYLAHADYALWEVILNGNNAVQMTKDEAGNEIEVPPVTAQQILARTRERKAKSTMLMAIPDKHLARFHGIKYAKTIWAAIQTRFGEGLDKGYDRFQRLLSLLEIHETCVSTKDANQKFLRSLPSAWGNISLIMRNKLGIDNLDIDDLYNNLTVYEADIKGSLGSSSNSQNVSFVSAESTNNTNELNAAYSVSTATSHSSQAQAWSNISLIMRNKPSIDNLDIDDLYKNLEVYEADIKGSSGSSSNSQNMDFVFTESTNSTNELNAAYSISTTTSHSSQAQDDLKEMDLKCQVAMLSMRVKRFYKKTRRKLEFNGKEQDGFDKTKTMKMEQYLAHADYALWEVILNANSAVQMKKDEVGNEIEACNCTSNIGKNKR
nr:ribonuclease H-like domain-containing protein [Tanacetum cinerariifolium]